MSKPPANSASPDSPRVETPTGFAALGVPAEVDEGLARAGFSAPFAIQTEAIPVALKGVDLCGRARTGSGKTLAFGVPMIARIDKAARVRAPRGLVLVTGPTGSGKSTTLCSLIDVVNKSRSDHVITIEDPIEFVHENKNCVITQRQVGVHTDSFKSALRAALREDPDIILVGELRDLETVGIAIETAETGHLVFGTLHTSSAAKTIDRIIDVFPAEEKEMVRAMLSESLRAVISQSLLKTKDGSGRVAAYEIMIGTPAIRNLIRENKVAQMYSAIQTGQQFGMQTLDQCLTELVRRNVVSVGEARGKARGEVRDDADVDAVTSLLVGALYARYLSGGPVPRSWPERTVRVVMRGIGRP